MKVTILIEVVHGTETSAGAGGDENKWLIKLARPINFTPCSYVYI